MVTLCISIGILTAGYWIYGKVLEKVFGADPERPTPAVYKADGVDFVEMPLWKIFLIQFLNIAGLGPIFGAVAGALWGPVAFLWIVLGSLFAGGVHDYFCGMMSVRHNGESVSEVSGYYLGNWIKQFMRGFTVLLMVIVGAVFLLGPAKILAGMTEGTIGLFGWTMIILVYYILSTILPIDKIIGRFYPVFGFALVFMSLGLFAAMILKGMDVPELGLSSFTNSHYKPDDFPVFPMLFVTIACGAVSGFHATQSPMMARCITNEKQGKKVFFGAMLTEGVVALIWAAISMSFFGGVKELNMEMLQNGDNTALVVNQISNGALGVLGGLLAVLGVVAAPITSGDTSFRSARIIIADVLKTDQKSVKNRLLISIPLFLAGYLLTLVNFGVIWRYFAWTNQMLATIVLWTVTVYLIRQGKNYWIALVPSVFMTAVVTAYILLAPEGFSLPVDLSVTSGIITAFAVMAVVLFRVQGIRREKFKPEEYVKP
ncbi:carbon starvation CstA family protein [Sinomicrobium soli]|uniref:carbon starvation CstA family protein n=1 Tax=Sinomicrobium sp. N-1-3-6 TaxID=2219864 RepID=UPI000DCB5ACD|nr:carbon starvation protein A [Sinomicrobium sp. N-1-3-6]RAV28628.1 carbon starvation protein A [Sinomicrobium sp. N-1-3-6]